MSEGSQNPSLSKIIIQHFNARHAFLCDESECCDTGMNITLDDIVRKAANMDMHLIKTDKYPHLSIEMILICFTGIAVAMGWIPI